MKYTSGQEIISYFESFSPKSLAMEGDKIGLQIGSLSKPVKKVMITLDVLEVVVDEAIENNVDLIIAHHPIIFRPLKNIITDHPSGRVFEKLIKHDISVYVAHTNLDVTTGGVNDLMAEALGLSDTEVLIPTTEEKLKKLVVFVPKDYSESLRESLGDIGAGHIGEYSHCSFSSEGTGRFKPLEGTNPFIGQFGKLESVEEVKLETIFPESMERKVISTLIKNHPYEEPAYDIYPLANNGKIKGLGRIGLLKDEITLEEFVSLVKEAFDVDGVRVVGDLNQKIKKVAVLGGDGNKYISNAKFKGADVYVTGDLYYHVAHDAQSMGLNVVDPGHNVEKVMKKGVQTVLEKYIEEKKFNTEIIISNANTDPFQFK